MLKAGQITMCASRLTIISKRPLFGLRVGLLFSITLLTSGRASIVSNATQGFADDLSAVILNSEDPALVRDGAPAFLLLLDGLLGEDPKDPNLLASAASLNSNYATAFVTDPTRQTLFANKAFDLSLLATCKGLKNACDLRSRPFDEFEQWVACLLYTSPSPRDGLLSRMPSSA